MKRLLLLTIKRKLGAMAAELDAIYEDGVLRPLQPLALPEHAHVRISIEALPEDVDRAAWLTQSERRLTEFWSNEADDVFNELLAR